MTDDWPRSRIAKDAITEAETDEGMPLAIDLRPTTGSMANLFHSNFTIGHRTIFKTQ